jgi:predicted metal-dependent hydrolase
VRLADELLRAGRPFHAHEVLEASWKSGPPAERDLWQGLAQIAVGLTHAHRGNARGAVTLLRRGAQRVRDYQDRYGIDVQQIRIAAETLAERIEQDGLDSIPPGDLRPGLNQRA